MSRPFHRLPSSDELDGIVISNTTAKATSVKCNFAATTSPTVSDDSSSGYSVFSWWIDTTSDDAYICVDSSIGAAVWKKIGSQATAINSISTGTTTLTTEEELDKVHVISAASTGSTIDLPSPVTFEGKTVRVVNLSQSLLTMSCGVDSGIDGSASVPVVRSVTAVELTAIGSTWTFTMRSGSENADTPVGSSIMWNTGTAPSGYLEENGQAVSRTTYKRLLDVIGTNFGAGDGSTTFNVPDMRGEFVRGWDDGKGSDPNAGWRSDRGDGTTGDNVGTRQADAFKSHTHQQNTGTAPGTPWKLANNQDAQSYNALYAPPTQATGGSETRPRNVNKMFCIKF